MDYDAIRPEEEQNIKEFLKKNFVKLNVEDGKGLNKKLLNFLLFFFYADKKRYLKGK